MGGAKGLVCPATGVEQFVNGGLESGGLSPGWTGDFSVVNYLPYEGTYHARATFGAYKTMTQNFANPIPVACFVTASIFRIYVQGGTGVSPPEDDGVDVYIIYTDLTETHVHFEVTASFTWQVLNLKPYLEAGKTVKGIRIESFIAQNLCDVDSCSLKI